MKMKISEVTRRNIIDYLLTSGYPFYGRLELLDFLGRIWDLSSMPSRDSRFKNAKGDLWQHTVNNDDYDSTYLLYDYFDLLNCSDEIFLKFLEMCLHPVVLANQELASKTLSHFNEYLSPDGYIFSESSKISGRTVYKATPTDVQLTPEEFEWDVFISHATEDKDSFVRELAQELRKRNIRVWYDEFTLHVGDSLRRSIDKGLAKSQYGIVVLSPSFFEKEWPQKELDGLAVRERNGQKVILPVWLNVDAEDVARFSPTLADRVAAKASAGLNTVVDQLLSVLRPNSLKQQNMSKPSKKQQKVAEDIPKTAQSIKSPINGQRTALNRLLTSTQLNVIRTNLTLEFSRHGFTPEMGYKDVLIAPHDPSSLKIDKSRLIPLVQNCRVHLRNWGGLDFPLEKRPETKEIRLSNGVRYIDTTPLAYSTKSFHFWQIDEHLFFFHRSSLDEDYNTDQSGETPLRDSLAYSWILMDITRPLLFTQNLLAQVNILKALTLKYLWGGLLGRSLVMLMHRRRGFTKDYRCQGVNEWNYQLIVNSETDMLREAQSAALELLWLFGWEPSEQAKENIGQDLRTFLTGTFPD
jgi:hypothetical protein